MYLGTLPNDLGMPRIVMHIVDVHLLGSVLIFAIVDFLAAVAMVDRSAEGKSRCEGFSD